jgi:hypothetical protein
MRLMVGGFRILVVIADVAVDWRLSRAGPKTWCHGSKRRDESVAAEITDRAHLCSSSSSSLTCKGRDG